MRRIGILGQIGYTWALSVWKEHEKELEERFPASYTRAFLKRLQAYREPAFVFPEQANGQVFCETPIGEGGLTGTIWKALDQLERDPGIGGGYAPVGCRVQIRDIPIRQEIVELAERYSENPYEIPSPGARLVIWEEIAEDDYPISSIGYLTRQSSRIVVLPDGTERFLTPPQRQQKDRMQQKKIQNVK